MATTIFFNDKKIKQPGVYSVIKSGIKNPAVVSDYGTVLLIDTGSGAEWGGGTGITSGAVDNGKSAIYEFTNVADAKSFVGGGLHWKLIEKLFEPKSGVNGASSVKLIRAAQTAASSLALSFESGSTGGGLTISSLNEGLGSNGVEGDSDNLVKGYSVTFKSGVNDTSKWIMQLWKGTWKGDYTDSIAFNEITKAKTKPLLLSQSVEFNNIETLYNWAIASSDFNDYFAISNYTKTDDGTIVEADITALSGNNLLIGGTETYSTDYLAKVIEAIEDEDFAFLLCDKYGVTDHTSAEVIQMISFINSKDNHLMKYGAGKDVTQFAQTSSSSRAVSAAIDNDKISTQHGECYLTSQTGLRKWDVLVHTAITLGREAGLEPQVPLTFKSIGVDGLTHELTSTEKDNALDWGIQVTYYDSTFQSYTCLQGINSLQDNTYLVNTDATTFSNQLKRIIIQLNNDIRYNAKIQLLGDESGVNRNTLSENFLKNWTKMFLESKVATQIQDNIILSFPQDKIKVTRQEDNYFIEYAVVPNNEITKLFFTGFLID